MKVDPLQILMTVYIVEKNVLSNIEEKDTFYDWHHAAFLLLKFNIFVQNHAGRFCSA